MDEFTQSHCSQINSHSIQLSDIEIQQLRKKLSGWSICNKQDELRLEKVFKFKDFNQAMAFSNQIAKEADQEDHHPAILTEWAKVTLAWYTHKIKGLHLNDFIMAAKSDQLYAEASNNNK